MYGVRLTRDFGESVPEPWKQAIAGLKRYEIDRGLRRLTSGGSGSPPTLPQFMKACKLIGEEDGPARPVGQPQLSGPELDPFVRAANLWFLNFLRANVVPNECLPTMIEAKNRLDRQYRDISTEDKVSDQEFNSALKKSWFAILNAHNAGKAA